MNGGQTANRNLIRMEFDRTIKQTDQEEDNIRTAGGKKTNKFNYYYVTLTSK